MSTTPANETQALTILVAVDYSEPSYRAVEAACALAVRAHRAVLHVVNVYHPPAGVQDALDALGGESTQTPVSGMIHADNELDLYCQKLQSSVPFPVVAHLRVGKKAASEIVQLGQELNVDVIVVGTHGRSGLARVVLGSVADAVARSASCPVLIARNSEVPKEPSITIEPPCPDCLATRAATRGAQYWCERHSERHPRPRTYREVPEGFAYGSQWIRPPGAK